MTDTRLANQGNLSGLPISSGEYEGQRAKMQAMDMLSPAIRQIIYEAPVPIDPVPLVNPYLRRGEAFVIGELNKFLAIHFPGYKPVQRRKK